MVEEKLKKLALYESTGLSPEEVLKLKKEVIELRKHKHGLTNTRLYKIWKGMRQRCNSIQHKDFKNYGARGIKISPLWDNFKTFYDWAISNGYKHGLSLDRINNDGNYEPSNCRWVTASIQQRNKRCKRLTFKGKTHTIAEWASILNVSNSCIRERIKRKLPLELVLKAKGATNEKIQ